MSNHMPIFLADPLHPYFLAPFAMAAIHALFVSRCWWIALIREEADRG